jgi:hypothetical protein
MTVRSFRPQDDSWYSILLQAESTIHSAAGRIRSIKKSNDLFGNRSRDLPACSIVPQSTTLPRAPRLRRVQGTNRVYGGNAGIIEIYKVYFNVDLESEG